MFQLRDVVNDSSVATDAQISFGVLVSALLRASPEIEFLGHLVTLFQLSWTCAPVSHSVFLWIEQSFDSAPAQAFVIIYVFCLICLNYLKAVSLALVCISPMIELAECPFLCLLPS